MDSATLFGDRPRSRNGYAENYRTGLLWQLFMNAPEVKQGLINLGFHSG
jgi:hypothetical protein